MTGDSQGKAGYAKSMIAAAKDLQRSSAFEPATVGVGDAVTLDQVKEDLRISGKRNRITVAVSLVVLLVVALFSLHLPYYSEDWGGTGRIYSTADVLSCYQLFFQTHLLPLVDATQQNYNALLEAEFTDMTMYAQVMGRAVVTLVIVVCGFLLAVSGLIFQSAFRNPLAAPTMLGVADGVSVGCIVFTLLGYNSMSENPTLYTVMVYGFGVLALLVVLLLSRFVSGKRTYSVFDMLLIGTVISQMLGGFVSYYSNFMMDDSTWENFYEMQQASQALSLEITYVFVGVIAVVTIVPTVLLGFRFNLISYPNADGRMLGARPGLLRGLALALGSIMQLAAIASIGQVAMVSLAVPFLVRMMFRNEFRYQLLGNFLVGAIVLLLCECVQSFAVFTTAYGSVTMPLGTIISFVIMPLFVWMMALQKRGWE